VALAQVLEQSGVHVDSVAVILDIGVFVVNLDIEVVAIDIDVLTFRFEFVVFVVFDFSVIVDVELGVVPFAVEAMSKRLIAATAPVRSSVRFMSWCR